MLSLLTGEALEGEEQYSMEAVADTYLRMNVPLDKKTALIEACEALDQCLLKLRRCMEE